MTNFSKNINFLVSGIYSLGVEHVIVCPGSRNAPLIEAFANHPRIKVFSQIDERSAAFKALGMSEYLQNPIAIVCTSGTALLNTYPAFTEAFYKQIPLIVISADRPPELINTWEGQSINQKDVFINHCHLSFHFDNNLHDELIFENFKTCFNKINQKWKIGLNSPVHINVALHEPIYEEIENLKNFEGLDFEKSDFENENFEEINTIDFSNKKILILNGYNTNFSLSKIALDNIRKTEKCLILNDICSVYRAQSNIENWELFINNYSHYFEDNFPDILITTGMGIVNKNLRNLLNKRKVKIHIHVSENGVCQHQFHKKSIIIKSDLTLFFVDLLKKVNSDFGDVEYLNNFKKLSSNFSIKIKSYNKKFWNEWNVLKTILPHLKSNSILHFANSMSVRYGSYLSQLINKDISVFCNRATSGIDGCSSTFVGSALVSDKNHYLITGDLAFLYDINAWWENEKLSHCKIILLNNQEGEIFNLVKGAENLTNAQLVHTPHQKNVKYICKHFNMKYYMANSFDNLEKKFTDFLNLNELALIEIKTNKENNINFFKYIKS